MRERNIHFITGLRRDFGGKPFILPHLLAILSARWVYPDHHIRVYFEHEPAGPLWEAAKRHVTPVPVIAPREVFGRRIGHFAHAADILRLTALIEQGGLYFDLDSIVLRPIDDLPFDRVVMGLEAADDRGGGGLCNAFIASPRGAPFLRRWLDSYRDFDTAQWNEHSVKRPYELAQLHPQLIHIEPRRSFFYPHFDGDSLKDIFRRCVDVSEGYSIHLWEAFSWRYLAALTPQRIAAEDSTYNLRARQVMAVFPDEMAAAAAAAAPPAGEADADHAYVAFLEDFMQWNDVRAVVQLGCGDWQALRRVSWGGIRYLGLDDAATVARNEAAFGSATIRFAPFAGMEHLPPADLFLCRDVHQGWPNTVIAAMLAGLRGRYRHALLTAAQEPLGLLNGAVPAAGSRPVDLARPPFNRRVAVVHAGYAPVVPHVRIATALLLDL